ncbi:MAG TPA: ribonucleoside-diphosphate reductase, adenosylcobalamin-dependent, partial [Deinococcales bacterium]|nr:ribonucleoside-diphosphate reductase, adenosylcobalamin-dependent [Deinococcales bacterium]
SVQGLEWVPAAVRRVFVCAHDVKPLDHVRMQGVVQQAFDREGLAGNSLSKTINLPNSATVADVEEAYSEAFRTGCKGITVYRDGSRQFQVLSTSKSDDKAEEAGAAAPVEAVAAEPVFRPGQPVYARPARLPGVTDMVKLTDTAAGAKRTFLITTSSLDGKPIEVILVSGRAGDEANADSEALGRVVSIALQYGVPAAAIQKTLRGINGGLYGSYNGRLVASKADLVAVALESTTSRGGVRAPEQPLLLDPDEHGPLFGDHEHAGTIAPTGEVCPECKAPALVREEGCVKCQNCGYSKCG